MARKRIEGGQLQTWDDVDQALKQIKEIDRDLAGIEAAQNEAIDRCKAEAKQQAAPLMTRKAGLELAIKDYAEANRADFGDTKSKELTFGVLSFRKSTSLVVKKVGDTLQALKSLGLHGCIRVKEELDKDALRNLSEETLINVGAGLKVQNTFGYELKRDALVEA